VAPGHCSPSRKVVSKMKTRSCSDFADALMMALVLLSFAPSLSGALGSVLAVSPECPGANARPALRGR
jgi:hypothetical protein